MCKWSFLFFRFYISFVFINEGVNIILPDFHILLHRLDLIDLLLAVVLYLTKSKEVITVGKGKHSVVICLYLLLF